MKWRMSERTGMVGFEGWSGYSKLTRIKEDKDESQKSRRCPEKSKGLLLARRDVENDSAEENVD